MISRIIFVIFTIAFLTFTWFYTGKAKSECAVNDVKGYCKCNAHWVTQDSGKNRFDHSAQDSPICCEVECPSIEAVFCSNECPEAITDEEKNQMCPGRKDKFEAVIEHECSCFWDTAVN